MDSIVIMVVWINLCLLWNVSALRNTWTPVKTASTVRPSKEIPNLPVFEKHTAPTFKMPPSENECSQWGKCSGPCGLSWRHRLNPLGVDTTTLRYDFTEDEQMDRPVRNDLDRQWESMLCNTPACIYSHSLQQIKGDKVVGI